MRLSNATKYFDRDVVNDAYTSAYLFTGQMIVTSERVSGSTLSKHTLSSTDPFVPPARGVVNILGDNWLFGNNTPDGFYGGVIRRSHSLKRALFNLDLLTPGQACLGTAGTSVYALKEFMQDIFDTRTSSDVDTGWHVTCSPTESATQGMFFQDGNSLLRIRNGYTTVEGFQVLEALDFGPATRISITFTSTSTLDLVTDSLSQTSVTTTALQTTISTYFKFKVQGESRHEPGDCAMFVAQSEITPTVGAELTTGSVIWRVLAVTSELDSWALHLRPA